MNKLLDDLGIDEKYTKPLKKTKKFTRVKDQVPPIKDYNFMADILFLPKDKRGYRYLLVIVDLADDSFDVEPLKSKEARVVLNAMKEIFKRRHLNEPEASIQTDAGSEFKGVFHKYLYNKNILHKTTLQGRHTQMANVERLNRTLGRLINGYMNKKEFETGKPYLEWREILDVLRDRLNKIRKRTLPKDIFTVDYATPDVRRKAKYKVGDVVYRALDQPRNVLNQRVSGETFRMGDLRWELVPRQITKVLHVSGSIPHRYMLSRLPNVSFTERQLTPADEEQEEFEIKELLELLEDEDGVEWYKVWWKGQPKKKATLVPREQLLKDAPKLVEAFESD